MPESVLRFNSHYLSLSLYVCVLLPLRSLLLSLIVSLSLSHLVSALFFPLSLSLTLTYVLNRGHNTHDSFAVHIEDAFDNGHLKGGKREKERRKRVKI